MATQSICAFAALSVPNFDERIRRRSDHPLASIVVLKGPNSFLMAFESGFALKSMRIPNLQSGVMGSCREFFLSCWVDGKGVNRIIVG